MRHVIREDGGALAIDATIALTLVMFLIMFIINIGGVYQAENAVYHGMLQTAKSVSLYSYKQRVDSEKETNIEKVATRILNAFHYESTALDVKNLADKNWGKADASEIAKKFYTISMGATDAASSKKVNKKLKEYGLEKGIESIDFAESAFQGKDIVIKATYDVHFLWPVFGLEKVTIDQSATSRLW